MMPEQEKTEDTFEEVVIDPDVPIYTTGVVCKILNVPVWVLKQLDKEGIVSPLREGEGQTRIYSKRELKKIQHCWSYINEHGVKMAGLKVILKMEQGIFQITEKG